MCSASAFACTCCQSLNFTPTESPSKTRSSIPKRCSRRLAGLLPALIRAAAGSGCDEGFDLSAYGPGGFVRVGDILSAWNSEETNRLPMMSPHWAAYHWTPGGDWLPVDSIDAGSKQAIRSYFRQAVPMVEAEQPSQSRIEKLRALGYAE